MGKNTKNLNQDNDDQNPLDKSLTLALTAAILTTVADAIAVLSALEAIEESIIAAEEDKKAQQELNDTLEGLQQQIDALTDQLSKRNS
ncbi:hypothetical protein [Halobacillus sp. B23F22_1]|uniref:hypothetical protein n=1 Tax=Halobacillus sp. B23F22_1 TaxID=3459514 RepID=UPI00373E7C57